MTRETAFVTGATGLLGNNLVRTLLGRGFRVRALARSLDKARRQFAGLPVDIVEGDVTATWRFADALKGSDILFHTAAYFRDAYKGGKHWNQLYRTNVQGTADLLSQAYSAGIRRFVHTSSIAVLDGPKGALIDETMVRREADANDYQRSKILADREVDQFLATHPDLWAAMVLPGWMHGPGDTGPTSAGQLVLDFVHRKLPGVVPGGFSVVDARDVAEAMVAVAERGRRGERYLAAGRPMTMAEIFQVLECVTGVSAPRRKLPMGLLYLIAAANEAWARVSKRPVLLSWATVRMMAREAGRTRFNHQKSERELGIRFRPIEETLRDEVTWYAVNNWIKNAAPSESTEASVGAR